MPELPSIPAFVVTDIPAVQASDKIPCTESWQTNLTVSTPGPTSKKQVSITFQGYSATAKRLSTDKNSIVTVSSDDLDAEVAKYPDLGPVMANVLMVSAKLAVAKLLEWQVSEAQKPVDKKQSELGAMQSALSRKQMMLDGQRTTLATINQVTDSDPNKAAGLIRVNLNITNISADITAMQGAITAKTADVASSQAIVDALNIRLSAARVALGGVA